MNAAVKIAEIQGNKNEKQKALLMVEKMKEKLLPPDSENDKDYTT